MPTCVSYVKLSSIINLCNSSIFLRIILLERLNKSGEKRLPCLLYFCVLAFVFDTYLRIRKDGTCDAEIRTQIPTAAEALTGLERIWSSSRWSYPLSSKSVKLGHRRLRINAQKISKASPTGSTNLRLCKEQGQKSNMPTGISPRDY